MSNFGIEVYHCGNMKNQLTTGLLESGLVREEYPINNEHLKNIA